MYRIIKKKKKMGVGHGAGHKTREFIYKRSVQLKETSGGHRGKGLGDGAGQWGKCLYV